MTKKEIIPGSGLLRVSPGQVDGIDDNNYIDDQMIREWALDKRTLTIGDEQSFQINWIIAPSTKEKRFNRFSLFARLISDPKVTNVVKKTILIDSLYERIRSGLYYPDHWTEEEYIEQTTEFNSDILEWCDKYCEETYVPAIQDFCNNAKEMLTNWKKYNSRVFDFGTWRLLDSLYEKLSQGLFCQENWTDDEYLEHAKKNRDEIFEWCGKYVHELDNPDIQDFCKNAKEMLTNWKKYNSRVFDFDTWRLEKSKKWGNGDTSD